MKKIILIATSAVVLILSMQACSTTTKNIRSERESKETELVKQMVENKEYKIEVTTALPSRGKTVNLTTPYELKIEGDSVYSHLPFFGRAYSVPYGGGDGLIFNGIMSDYKVKKDKKDNYQISFDTKSKEDRLQFFITITPNGNSNISVISGNRSNISYMGSVDIYGSDKKEGNDN